MDAKILTPGSGRAINVLGADMIVRLTGQDTGGAFALVEQTTPPGAGVPTHLHENEDELFHVLEGQMEFTVDGKAQVAGEGTTVFLPRNQLHSFIVVGDSPARALIQVFPSGADAMWQELGAMPAGDGPPDMGRVLEICARYGVKFLPPAAE